MYLEIHSCDQRQIPTFWALLEIHLLQLASLQLVLCFNCGTAHKSLYTDYCIRQLTFLYDYPFLGQWFKFNGTRLPRPSLNTFMCTRPAYTICICMKFLWVVWNMWISAWSLKVIEHHSSSVILTHSKGNWSRAGRCLAVGRSFFFATYE